MDRLLCASCWFLLIPPLLSEQLLHSVSGEVGQGNYTYYSLMYEGHVSLYLYSKTGDADLYVSQTLSKPTFEPDSHCLQSVTCGIDIVHIPRSFQRPVGIGVYGHPSHEVSVYLLEVIYKEEVEEEELYELQLEEQTTSSFEDQFTASASSNNINSRQQRTESKENVDNKSVVWGLILSFIDILVEVLFL